MTGGYRNGATSSDGDAIVVRGARQHNLKDIDLRVPRTSWWLLLA